MKVFVALLGLVGGLYYYYYIDNSIFDFHKKEEVITNTKISFFEANTFENFVTNVNKINVKNNEKVKYKDIRFLKHGSYLSLRLYNDYENAELNIKGEIEVEGRMLNRDKFNTFEARFDLKENFLSFKNAFKAKNCKEISSDNTFLYINKGMSVVLRTKKQFVSFNILQENKVFVWEELNSNINYMLCDFDTLHSYNKLNNLLKTIRIAQ